MFKNKDACIHIKRYLHVLADRINEGKMMPALRLSCDVGEGATEIRLSEVLQKKCLAAESPENANKQMVSLYQYINTNSHSLH